MKVKLIAHTVFNEFDNGIYKTDYEPHWNSGVYETDNDELSEFAGRFCYRSWSRPNPETATNKGYIKNILKQQHYSVLEHASATFVISGVSRSLTHELVRHRHLSYSQVSQRYVDSSQFEPIIPPAVYELPTGEFEMARDAIVSHFNRSVLEYEMLAKTFEDNGFQRKQAREAARAVLPNCTETEIVVTGNMRAWRDMIQKRNSPGADAEIRHMAKVLLGELVSLAPNTFQDLVTDPIEEKNEEA